MCAWRRNALAEIAGRIYLLDTLKNADDDVSCEERVVVMWNLSRLKNKSLALFIVVAALCMEQRFKASLFSPYCCIMNV